MEINMSKIRKDFGTMIHNSNSEQSQKISFLSQFLADLTDTVSKHQTLNTTLENKISTTNEGVSQLLSTNSEITYKCKELSDNLTELHTIHNLDM